MTPKRPAKRHFAWGLVPKPTLNAAAAERHDRKSGRKTRKRTLFE